MATALAYPDVEKGGRGKKSVLNTELSVSSGYLAHARFVLRNCRDKALEVLRKSLRKDFQLKLKLRFETTLLLVFERSRRRDVVAVYPLATFILPKPGAICSGRSLSLRPRLWASTTTRLRKYRLFA